MIEFTYAPGITEEHLGFVPYFFSQHDGRPAKEQINEEYAHGGGWRPLEGWVFNEKDASIKYPGDPKLKPIAWTTLRDERLFFYDMAWLAVVQPDGSYEVGRLD
jgi:hypothetical protein